MTTKEELKYGRPIKVHGMAYAPISENGVIYLFGRLAPRLGFNVERIHPHCPDCIATHNGVRKRIEFEFRASEFETHDHSPKKADMVVCWADDWGDRPKKYRNIEVFSLMEHADAAPRVHFVGCGTENMDELDSARIEWNVSNKTLKGDLILMYRSAPVRAICDAWKVVRPFRRYGKRNKDGRWPGRQAYMRRVVQFKRRLDCDRMKRDPRTRNLSVVRRNFIGKMDVTLDWNAIYRVLVELNPESASKLKDWVVD